MKTYKFKAKIEGASLGGACVYFPYNVEEEFGTRGRVPVKATFDGVSYSGSLVKYGAPQHMLGILKGIREQIGKGPGDTVDVTIEKDESERTVEVPAELQKLLKKEKLVHVFEKLSYSHKREYCRWITEAKREETRANRLVKAVEMLRSGVGAPDSAGRSPRARNKAPNI
jgi:bifunctional DNA-binding transcriptional regulator/antitoxin component of YhaV-PrlF toxin-antitoxin module